MSLESMLTLTGCSSSNLITLNFRTTINGVSSLSSSIHKKPPIFSESFGFKSNNSCYFCQKGWRREFLSTHKNGGLFDRLLCFSKDSDEDADAGSSSKDSNLATKEKEKEIVVEEREDGIGAGEFMSENKPTSFSSSEINRLPPGVVKYFTDPDAIEPPDMQLLLPFVDAALPLAYGVLGVQMFHEIGHFLAAFPKNVKLSIPYFIPNITLGSFGAITQFKSILPDRKTQVDISLAGPFAGAALSLSMFAVGLLLSSNPDVAGDFVQVPSTLFQGSLLLGLISRATLGYTAMHAASVSIHPLVIAGWCGLTSTAFNLLPVGCLDGGRAVQGAYGKNALIAFGLTTYALLGLGVLGGPLSLPWGLYVLICQRTPEKPCLNDVTEVGSWRKAVVVGAIFMVVMTLLPVWDELAEELGIGLVTTF
ncbi:probable zinc metalloprotease EGY1, chloroplastic isoform X2 [Beta vulgaris subsp. vulgaris]|uniref:probable zinc metalloprotease EGY1, chloroplastic isoform X2 n=1 Tax=Beta vulgaris subsp. vulgaris TaxID=3555 RepID=UPI0020371EB6|nr:probable zinc metalloprotease EGY1, chloroplastic isoform X2 [Beta vulgaris subsp. vulgaris]